jgi:hypothetical protein
VISAPKIILFNPEDGGSTCLINVGEILANNAELQPRRWYFHGHRCENLKSNILSVT